MKRRELLLGGAGIALAALGTYACRREGSDPPDRGKILADLSTLVFVPAYAEALADARALEVATTLEAARTAWKKARRSWKVTDAFLFGPADDLSITAGAIDTAADFAKLEELTMTPPASADVLGANVRGFPAIEALLFDPTKSDADVLYAKSPVLFTVLAADLRMKIEAISNAWATDYGNQLATAGRGSTTYASERQGFDAVINALISAAEVLIALRLAKPLGLDKTPAVAVPELVESPRSDVSVDDLLAVLDGIERVYLGAGGLPVSAAVVDRSPDADTRMRADLASAKTAVGAIPGPLRTAVTDRRDPVIAAHAAVREVKRRLTTEVAGALGTSIGFTVTDGD